LDQPGIGLRCSEHQITRKHRALGKSSENGLARICAEFVFDFLEELQHGLASRSKAFGDLVREIAHPTCRLIRRHARHVDEPPGARIPRPETQRERAFGKYKPRPGRHGQDVSHRHKIVPWGPEAVQEQDERTATSALSICAACDPRPQPAYLIFSHERPVISYTNIAAMRRCRRAMIQPRVVGKMERTRPSEWPPPGR